MKDLNSLLQKRLFELTHYARPTIMGDRRHMDHISSTSPLDCPNGPETREGLICNVVRMGFTPDRRPSIQSLVSSLVR